MITDENIVKFLKKIADSKGHEDLIPMEEEARINYIPIIHKDALELLTFLIRLNKSRRILELGCAVGYSSIVMARISDSITVDTIDRDKKMIEKALVNFEKFGVSERVHLYEGEIVPVMENLINDGKKYDFIFMDAGKSHYREYTEKAFEMLSPGGMIFCDNILIRGEVAKSEIENKKNSTVINNMKRFIDHISENKELNSVIIPIGDGVMLISGKSDGE